MRIAEFHKLLRRRPFEPFHIHLSDGATYPVTHPDQLILTPRAAYVGLDTDADGLTAQDVVICDLVHITRLTPVDGVKRKRRRKNDD
ncbi:MAG: hypothetical protein PVI86_14365 [Phycisphaerae bacterium]|jgi:hypothetical protein